jgi:aldehyde:ferredoxin oxidoreductase
VFNLREGQKPTDDDSALPKRCIGEPPLKEGPLKGITVDHRMLVHYFCKSMGWDEETLIPIKESLENLGGMEDVIRDLYR